MGTNNYRKYLTFSNTAVYNSKKKKKPPGILIFGGNSRTPTVVQRETDLRTSLAIKMLSAILRGLSWEHEILDESSAISEVSFGAFFTLGDNPEISQISLDFLKN